MHACSERQEFSHFSPEWLARFLPHWFRKVQRLVQARQDWFGFVQELAALHAALFYTIRVTARFVDIFFNQTRSVYLVWWFEQILIFLICLFEYVFYCFSSLRGMMIPADIHCRYISSVWYTCPAMQLYSCFLFCHNGTQNLVWNPWTDFRADLGASCQEIFIRLQLLTFRFLKRRAAWMWRHVWWDSCRFVTCVSLGLSDTTWTDLFQML